MKINKRRGNAELGCIAIIIVFGIAFLVLYAMAKDDQNHKGYDAWVKQTENPKHLTYEEWHALMESTKRTEYIER